MLKNTGEQKGSNLYDKYDELFLAKWAGVVRNGKVGGKGITS